MKMIYITETLNEVALFIRFSKTNSVWKFDIYIYIYISYTISIIIEEHHFLVMIGNMVSMINVY